MTIQLIAFDIGGVLANIDKRTLLAACQKSHIPPEDFFDNDFLNFQKGLLSEEEFITLKCSQLSLAPSEFTYIFNTMIQPTILSKYLTTIRIPWIFFSSINTLHYHYFLQHIKANNFTRHHSILSFQEKCLKPHEQLFAKLSNIVPIRPSHILVIDDKPINIKAALSYGFKAQLVQDFL